MVPQKTVLGITSSKKAYASPQLIEWGSLADLTKSSPGTARTDSLNQSGLTGLIAPPNYLPES